MTYENGLGIDDKLRSKNVTTARYFLTDHLGSTVAITDASGKITSSTSYDSFGNAIPKQVAGSAASVLEMQCQTSQRATATRDASMASILAYTTIATAGTTLKLDASSRKTQSASPAAT